MSNTQTKVVFYNDDSNLNKLASYLGIKKDEMKKKRKHYECWIKTGRDDAIKIKPSNKLIRSKKHNLSRYQEKLLNERMIEEYYIKIKPANEEAKSELYHKNKPLYSLYLGA